MEETVVTKNELMDKTGEMQEILSRVPGRIVRYGTVVAVAVILSIISLTWFIQYPEYSENNILLEKTPDGNFIAVMQVGQYDIGKLSKGQAVMIALNSFPYQEYGYLRGNISTIADEANPTNGQFRVQSSVPLDAHTMNNKALTLKAGMTGTARIIIREQKLIERIINANKY
ncbi:HlyD family efflux transporter periplasmic adaptor subunit [Chitinophaga pendula]|uniref:HlyD family efflux transporter periplasmic adaptor subunit n=1 Tax=Chitinophaga TaxID=79328 RepID=UPI000BAEB14F|nr:MULTISPECIES: HlyD family efflux transporter periplasmic adaptor subunit [Chitinophaga]ASZ12019.1 hypothetical protein CK934_14145 [Chitinophaga sp. MD30]UCJ04948.1 HlyD family efflux transporter periplasmic adaptor subunit [Chitinophaga pendula]